jgi:hypothetical protein
MKRYALPQLQKDFDIEKKIYLEISKLNKNE